MTDVVGLTQGFTPRHARRFGEVGAGHSPRPWRPIATPSSRGTFPAEAESSTMDEAVLAEVLGRSSLDQPDVAPGHPPATGTSEHALAVRDRAS